MSTTSTTIQEAKEPLKPYQTTEGHVMLVVLACVIFFTLIICASSSGGEESSHIN